MSNVNISDFFWGGSSGGGSGGGGGIPFQRVFTTSQTFTAPVDGNYLITAIGCGGGGPGGYQGGGAGGLAQSRVSLVAGDSLVLIVGTSPSLGVDGGNTTVTGASVSLVAEGGKSSGLGGTSSGGNILNVDGGSGNLGNAAGGGGGGAVGVYGVVANAATAGYGANVSGSTTNGYAIPGLEFSLFQTESAGGLASGHPFIGGRLLQPAGVNFGGNYGSHPGAGGTYGGGTAGRGGLFAGGGGSNGSSPGDGGPLGGGGGGGGGSAKTRGGTGGVIIEWVM